MQFSGSISGVGNQQHGLRARNCGAWNQSRRKSRAFGRCSLRHVRSTSVYETLGSGGDERFTMSENHLTRRAGCIRLVVAYPGITRVATTHILPPNSTIESSLHFATRKQFRASDFRRLENQQFWMPASEFRRWNQGVGEMNGRWMFAYGFSAVTGAYRNVDASTENARKTLYGPGRHAPRLCKTAMVAVC